MYNKYYRILEISVNSNDKEIKTAYKRLAKKYHPDLCSLSNASEKFIEVKNAYEVLINKSIDPFEEIRRKQNEAHREFQRQEKIRKDKELKEILDDYLEIFIDIKTSIYGDIIEVMGNKVRLPPKIKNGTKLKIKGKGRSQDYIQGDLFVTINISDDKYLLENDNIFINLNLNLIEMIFGTLKEVDVLGEKLILNIEENSFYGQEIKVYNQNLGYNLIFNLKLILPNSKQINKNELKVLIKDKNE